MQAVSKLKVEFLVKTYYNQITVVIIFKVYSPLREIQRSTRCFAKLFHMGGCTLPMLVVTVRTDRRKKLFHFLSLDGGVQYYIFIHTYKNTTTFDDTP